MVSSISTSNSYLLQMLLQTTQQRQNDLFTKVDTSGDSKVDKTEFSALAKKLSEDAGSTIDTEDVFATYDANGDGTLSEDELKTFMEENAPPPNDLNGPMGQMSSQAMQENLEDLFSKIDSDGDSAISESEFSTFASNATSGSGTTSSVEDIFSTYDTDGDGTLSEEELSVFMKDNPPPPPPKDMNGASQAMQQNLDDLFSKIDSDGDSAISESEFSTFASNATSGSGTTSSVEDIFSTYDTDGDGTLSEEELSVFMKDNPPPPPPTQMQSAMSAYGANSDSEQLSDIFDILKTQFSGTSSLSITV